jgi:hypothetical protein
MGALVLTQMVYLVLTRVVQVEMVVKVVRAVLVELVEPEESLEMEGLVLRLLVTRMEGTQTVETGGTQTVEMLTAM